MVRSELQEGSDCRQACVAASRAIAAILLQVIEETEQHRCIEIGQSDGAGSPVQRRGRIGKKQAQGVPIRRYGLNTYSALLPEMIHEEALHERW
jgi:hypothetical protein